jgi:hypothetical protein
MKIQKKYLEVPFDCIKSLIIEPCFKFTSEGLFINSFSECQSAVCIFKLPKTKFIEYEFEGEQKFKIQIDILAKVMKRIKTKFVNLDFKDERIVISDEKGKEYSIAVMIDEEVQREVPQLEFNTRFEMESLKLQNLFLDASIVGDSINLNYENNKLNISSGELNKFKEEIECNGNGSGKVSYSLEFLNKFMSASKYFKNVIFEFSSDSPCKLTFRDELEIQFVLAPRVSDED